MCACRSAVSIRGLFGKACSPKMGKPTTMGFMYILLGFLSLYCMGFEPAIEFKF